MRATVASTSSGVETSIEPTTPPFAGLRISICSARAVAPFAPSACVVVVSLGVAVPLSTVIPFVSLGWSARP